MQMIRRFLFLLILRKIKDMVMLYGVINVVLYIEHRD